MSVDNERRRENRRRRTGKCGMLTSQTASGKVAAAQIEPIEMYLLHATTATNTISTHDERAAA